MKHRQTTDKPQDDRYTVPVSCAICDKCWYWPEAGMCRCGGPFSGYLDLSKEKLTSS